MSKTKIEWCDYTINPVKGLCPVACPYCYARRMYKRFKWDETIRFDPSVFNDIPKMKAGRRVFVGSTIELFGEWIDPAWMMLTFERVRAHPELTFIFLTKQPHNLTQWSPFPDNCWVGVSVTANGDLPLAYYGLNDVQAGERFISFEPLHGKIGFNDQVSMKGWVDWVIIGAQTPYSPKTVPRIEWVREIVDAADWAEIPVFLKDNLANVVLGNKTPSTAEPKYIHKDGGWYTLRQESPAKKLPEKQGVVYLQSQV